jgi:hypothetical protein
MSDLQQLRTTPPYDEPWKVAALVNLLTGGRVNSVGSVTLARNHGSTTLNDNNIRLGSKLFFTPTTAHAAQVTGLWYAPAAAPGSVTLGHSAVDQPDLDFDYVIFT